LNLRIAALFFVLALTWAGCRPSNCPPQCAGADLRGVDLRRFDLAGADLRGANLAGADLSGPFQKGLDLSGADLTGANLTGANLSGVNLSQAVLHEAGQFVAQRIHAIFQRIAPIQYKYPGPLKRKKYFGEIVPQLPVSMGDQEHVSASIDSRPFFRI